jgi:uncharacterized membrane protein/protein-disulfide isomerase
MLFLSALLNAAEENCINTVCRLRDCLQLHVTTTTIKTQLQEHPDYPSLLSISDILTNYGVENIAIKTDMKKIDKLPLPLVAQVKNAQGVQNVFTVIRKITERNVECLAPEQDKWVRLTEEEFTKRWTGIVLLADPLKDAGEKDYFKKRKEEKRQRIRSVIPLLALLCIAFTAIFMAFINNGPSAALPAIFLVVSIIGCFTTVLLFQYELGQYNPMLQQICGAGKKTSCNAILNSKASKIAGVSWTQIGFCYFMGVFLCLLFSGITNSQILFLLGWLNVLAMPYSVFSVYYQWRVAKQWCVLCLTVQALLVLQFVIALAGDWHGAVAFTNLDPFVSIATALAFSLPPLITELLLPALRKAREANTSKTALQRVKHSPQIFNALLEKQKALSGSSEGLGLVLGNPNATHKIIKVCNPYCGPCAKAHSPIEELLHNNPDVQVQIIFTATNDKNDIKAAPVKHLLAIAEKGNEETVKQALDDWYLADKKDYVAFAAKYPMNGELQKQVEKIEAMREWCEKAKITSTPTFFVSLPSTSEDGQSESFHQLPEMYSVADLRYFLQR